MPAPLKATAGTLQALGKNDCPGCRNPALFLFLGYQLLQTLHATVKFKVAFNDSADRCTVTENLCCNNFGK
jgi:hypothetical protein